MLGTSKVTVHAGDFLKDGAGAIGDDCLVLATEEDKWGKRIPMSELEHVDVASEESVKRLSTTSPLLA